VDALPLTWWQLALGALGAVLVGLSKTGIPGIGVLNVAIFALAFPARDSVGMVLIILICADLVAVRAYRNDVDWSQLRRLFPWAMAGVVAGSLALGRIDDVQLRRAIGAILLLLVGLQYARMRRPTLQPPPTRWFAPLAGVTAGFTTMVANAAGPVMMLYLLAMQLPKLVFVGTSAWYFFAMNLFKVPFSAALGLINPHSLLVAAWIAPFAMLGAAFGRPIVMRLNQQAFERLALLLTVVAGLVMVR
jgi:uncharacterized membrane protein YfcA